MMKPSNIKYDSPFKQILQKALYAHKWILYIFYWGIVIGLAAYAIEFLFFLKGFLLTFLKHDESWTMIGLLTLVDMCMVANLSKMIVTGSYQAFIDKVPENTEKVSSSLLKVKMSTSLVGVTAIHLLKVFVEQGEQTSERQLYLMIGIHALFLISSLTLSFIDFLHSKSEYYETKAHTTHHTL